jgi:hypothetical protein
MCHKLDLFPSSDGEIEIPILLDSIERSGLIHMRLAISKEPNRVGVALPSPGNRSSLRNIVFSSYSEFPMMDKIHKSKILNQCGVQNYQQEVVIAILAPPLSSTFQCF